MTDSFNQTDDSLLASFDRKLQLIRDRVRGVAKGYHTSAYLVGRSGTSKTFTVKQELDRLGTVYVVHNARMTPMGLFDYLEQHPEHVVVLDDIASLFQQQAALQILMAALDGDPQQPRIVTYRSKDRDAKFNFSGGIIAISNVPLRHDPLAQAVSSRVVHLEHEPSDEELAAFMRLLATQGYKNLTSDSCREVVDFVIAETRACDDRLDLRHLTKAFDDRRQWEAGHAETDWKDLVRSSLQRLAQLLPLTKRDEIETQRQRVREAIAKYPDDRSRQIEESRLKKSTFYERFKEVSSES